MKKSKYVKIVFFCVVLTVGLWYGRAQSQQLQPKSKQRITSDIGRDNPFAEISIKENFTSQNVPESVQSGLESTDLFVETVTLKFLDARNLKTAIAGMVSEHGTISIDGKSNSLIVCDTKENLEKILAQIKKADRTPKQIMVEVVILDVQLDNDTEIGINWDILSDKTYDTGYRQNFTTRLGSTLEDATNIGNATAFNTTGLGGNFSVISGTIRNVVHLIQQKRNVEILASPRVMMVSGESANIEAVDEIPYQEVGESSQGGDLTYYNFKLVGVKLQVTATLTDGNDILLTVNAEQNVQVGTTTPPRVDTRKASSSLLLKDGEVVVFGGLRRQEKTKEVDQIPLLGDLPIIGGLFKSTDTVVKNSELIVFLSPHIYKGESPPKEQMAKFKEISERPILSLPKDKDKKKKKNGWFSQSDKQPQGK
jgi:type IV pilus assembly protein PilQ